MPNWCYNKLKVDGPEDDLKRFQTLASRRPLRYEEKEESALFFDSLYPLPKELDNTTSPAKIVSEEDYEKEVKKAKKAVKEHPGLGLSLPITQKMSDELKRKYGADNWYDWCVAHWGTKWDASDVYLESEEYYDGQGFLEYNFSTAWSPPIAWITEVARRFPTLTFRVTYDEEGEGFMGYAKAEEGKLVQDDCIDMS